MKLSVGVVAVALFAASVQQVVADGPKPRLVYAHKAADAAPEPHRRLSKTLIKVYERMAEANQFSGKLLYSPDRAFNAFAMAGKDDARYIAFYRPLLEAFEGDHDALAYVIGHEIAHHQEGHTTAGRDARAAILLLGAIAGAVIDHNLQKQNSRATGAGQLAGRAAGTLIMLKYTRDQEREADAKSVYMMARAGFDPAGALRAQRVMLKLAGGSDFTLFHSHPSSQERVENLDVLIRTDPVIVKAVALASQHRTSQPVMTAQTNSSHSGSSALIPAPAIHTATALVASTPSSAGGLWRRNPRLQEVMREAYGKPATELANALGRMADEGDAEAAAELAGLFMVGRGVEQDKKRGCALGRSAWSQGAKNAVVVVAGCLADGYGDGDAAEDRKKAFELATEGWERHRVRSALRVKAMLQEKGYGTEKNLHVAEETLTEAVRLGDAAAASRLAFLMASGALGARNSTAVDMLHREAALRGQSLSMVEHARALLKAKGRAGVSEAYNWLCLAERSGNTRATQTRKSMEADIRKTGVEADCAQADNMAVQVRATRDTAMALPW